MSHRVSSLLNRVRTLLTRAGAAEFEALESREVMAAVSWDGGASTANWQDAANWSNDVVPGSADDVTIPSTALASINFGAATGSRTINSLTSDEALSFSGGSLAVLTTASISGQVTLTGGALSGGTYTLTGGATMTAAAGAASALTNVTINGDVVVTTGTLRLAGTTQFTAARLVGAGATLQMAPGYTLNSPVIAEGAAAGARTVQLGAGGTGTGTIGPSGSITLATGVGGSLTINDSSNATLVNNGLIAAEASGQTLTVGPNAVTNNGTMRVSAGTMTVIPTGSYTNPGTIEVSGGTLNLDSTFNATSGIGTWNRTGGTVNVRGAITNTASTFTLNASTGSWNMAGGSISGGTVNVAGGNGLVMTATGGTLSSVAYGGEILLPAGTAITTAGTTTFVAARLTGASTLRVAPGATINSPVIAEGVATGTRNVQLGFGNVGTGTIGAAGSITLAANSGGPLTINDSSNATLVNNGLIAAEAAGQTLTVGPNAVTNNGTLRVAAGTMTVTPTGSYTSPGTIEVSGGTLNLDSTFNATSGIGTWNRTGGAVNLRGAITNTGSSFTLSASTGSWNMAGGSISGGTVNVVGGNGLVMTSSGGTLSNVNYGAEILLPAGTAVTTAGATTFVAARLTGASTLRVAPGATISSPVIAEGAAAGMRNVQFGFGNTGTGTLGPSGSITLAAGSGGSLTINDSSNTTFVNNGLIAAGQTLTISTNVMSNGGTIRVAAGTLTIAPTVSYTNAGTIEVSGGTLNLDSALNATAGIGSWNRTGGTVNLRGTLTNTGSTFTLNASTGSWNIAGGTISGGTVNVVGGNGLVMTNSGGTLSNLNYTGELLIGPGTSIAVGGATRFQAARLTGAQSILRFLPGYTLNDSVSAEGPAAGTRLVQLAFGNVGTNTIGATGSIRLAPGAGGGLTIDQSSNATLVNNGVIAAEALGRSVTIGVQTLGNLSGTTLTGGAWVADNGATLNIGTGRSVVTNNAVLRIEDASSNITGLTGLTTNNGSFVLAGGKDFTAAAFTNNGTLNLGPASQLTVNGAFTQASTGVLALTLGGNAAADLARVVATGVATVGGAWSVGAVTSFPPVYGDFFDLVSGSSRVGSFSSFTSGYVPAGVFVEFYSPSAARVAFDRRAGVWTGLGDGTTWSDAANWFNNTLPTIADTAYIGLPSSSPVIHMPAGAYVVGSIVSTEAFVVDVGATLTLTGDVEARFEGGLANHGVIVANQNVVALSGGTHDGRFALGNGRALTLGGTQVLGAASVVEGAATIVVDSGVTSLEGELAPTLSLQVRTGSTASLARSYSLVSVVNEGALNIGVHSLTLTGTYTQAESGTLAVELVDDTTVGTIAAATASLAGGLDVTSSSGFDPSNPMLTLYEITVVSAQSLTGDLTVGAQPQLTVGSFQANRVGNTLRLMHNIADFNGDGGVDADDVIEFFTAWDNGLILGDVNGDGGVDSDDVIFFFGQWDQGGR